MSSYEVVVAGYPPHGTAQQDFDELVRRITAKEVRSEGAILVEKREDGEVVVTQTGDHLGRKGMGWGGGVGVLVGLAAPPMLAAVTVGAAAGARGGQVREAQAGVGSGGGPRRQSEAGDGGGDHHHRHRGSPRGRAGAERLACQVGRADGGDGPRRPQGRVGRGDGQVQARPHGAAHSRPHLRRHDRAHHGRLGRRLDDRRRHEAAGGCTERADRADRRRRLRRARHVRRQHPDAEPDPRATGGPHVQPLPRHRRVLADPGGAAHRAEPPPRGHGWHRRVPRTVPRLHRHAAALVHRAAADPEGERLQDGWLRQVAHDARSRDGTRRAPSSTGRSGGGSTTGGAS